ncbi:outer membrane immunogenic protein [Roseibium hamelinense]|uniref:Outer membrane immunogenic protein n=1 Tax=Roseibium hamelinense TaxID=150831 RepID=A0A562T0X1_9HYPH|nr:outer membrane beta-barrel protein [Roseibium hamelinense]MTI44612.1 porin family protein [Roseibium hamelinense]TWI87239.1 outer membrane immunogenic protein [Roseibium hamelinense]
MLASPSVLAADLPQPQPAFDAGKNWQGFYSGGQFGYGWLKGEDNLGTPSSTLDSVIGGVHAGYNHQFGNLVLGLEGEANLTNLSSTTSVGFETNSDWMLAGLVRAGFAFDRFFAYGSTGVSLAEISFKSSARGTKDSNTHTGVLLGAGIEALVTDSVSVGLDYQHHWFASKTYNLGGNDFKVDGDLDLVRARVSYHF